jgi:hypothetical protein
VVARWAHEGVGPSIPAGDDILHGLEHAASGERGDLESARALSAAIRFEGTVGPPVSEAAMLRPTESLLFYAMLNEALRGVPLREGEAGLMAMFDRAGFGPGSRFNPDALPDAQKLGLGCALRAGPGVLSQRGFRPTHVRNGWMWSSNMADPGFDYLLRAEAARGGYVNDPRESIYPAAITDDRGEPLQGDRRYRIRFSPGALPPVDGFWSITAYDRATSQLIANPIGRYNIGDRTPGLVHGADGSLTLQLFSREPPEGPANWLPVPATTFHLVLRMYLPHAQALDGTYAPPMIERIDQ